MSEENCSTGQEKCIKYIASRSLLHWYRIKFQGYHTVYYLEGRVHLWKKSMGKKR